MGRFLIPKVVEMTFLVDKTASTSAGVQEITGDPTFHFLALW